MAVLCATVSDVLSNAWNGHVVGRITVSTFIAVHACMPGLGAGKDEHPTEHAYYPNVQSATKMRECRYMLCFMNAVRVYAFSFILLVNLWPVSGDFVTLMPTMIFLQIYRAKSEEKTRPQGPISTTSSTVPSVNSTNSGWAKFCHCCCISQYRHTWTSIGRCVTSELGAP